MCHMIHVCITLSFFTTPAPSARILSIIPTPSPNHQIVFQPLWRELSLRGHQVTLLTTNPANDPRLANLTEIDLSFSYQEWDKISSMDTSQLSLLEMIDEGVSIISSLIDQQLQHPDVQSLLQNHSEHFDLVLVELAFPAMYAFAERFECPFIGVSSLDATSYHYDTLGNPSHPVLNPDFVLTLDSDGDMSFLDRLISVVLTTYMKYYTNVYLLPSQQLMVRKHFGIDYPPLQNLAKNISLMFVNADPIFYPVRPLLPTVVQIGGEALLKPKQPLPKDLQHHLDNAMQGFIYFSLGSQINSKDLSQNTSEMFLDAFSELPYLVLWKFDQEDLPDKPNNVMISKWFPQQNVLRHPNVKLFITHGSIQSIKESVYSHVPIIGMPFFGDQPCNVNRIVVAKGLGLAVDHATLDKESFKKTIFMVINNPKYRTKVEELAQLAKDQPMTGLERAVWWTEYVIRHKGAKILKSPANNLPLYQYFLLDVIGVCFLIILMVSYLAIASIRITFKLVKYFMSPRKVKHQ